jgi:hypothetical protein
MALRAVYFIHRTLRTGKLSEALVKRDTRLNYVFVTLSATLAYLLASGVVSCGGGSNSILTSTLLAPTNLTATAGNAQVSLSWTASTGATSYNVLRSTTNGGPYTTSVGSTAGTTLTDTTVVNGTTYYYVVTATNSAGTSGNSSQASATPQFAPPPAPTNLTATAGNAQVSLSWTASTGATSYNVLRSTTNGGPYTTSVGSTAGTTLTDTTAVNGTTYYYVVTATNSAGTSGNSNEASATPSAGPAVSLVMVGHTTSTNFPVTNGSTYKPSGSTSQSGVVSVLARGSGSTTLTFSTYLGGASGNPGTQVRDVWIDPSGNIYVGGTTSDTASPTTSGVFQPTYGGGPDDAFIAKYSSMGTLLWASYLGTGGTDIEEKVYGIAGYDPNGDLTVCGRMNGAATIAGVPMSKFGPSTNNIGHAYVAKVKPDGSAVVWFSMVGGSSTDSNRGRCVLDSSGNVYAEGSSASRDFPTTAGAYQTTNRSTQPSPGQAIVYKISSSGSQLLWSTYVGGAGSVNGGDSATGGIALDSSGNVFFSGFTYSADIGASPGAYQTALPDASLNGSSCYVGKLRGDGSAMVALTYLGGSALNTIGSSVFSECMALNLDSSGNVVVQGITPYKDFPTTAAAYQTAFRGGNYEAFVSKLSPDLTTLIASTFIGGSGNETGDSSARIEFDVSGNIYTALTTDSTDFPATPDAYQTFYQGGPEDEVACGLSSDLKALVYSTYLGGNGTDYNRSFRLK